MVYIPIKINRGPEISRKVINKIPIEAIFEDRLILDTFGEILFIMPSMVLPFFNAVSTLGVKDARNALSQAEKYNLDLNASLTLIFELASARWFEIAKKNDQCLSIQERSLLNHILHDKSGP